MKIKTYIKSCNPKQLAQFLASSYWSDKTFHACFFNGNETIEAQGEYLYKHTFQEEIPEIIRYGQNSWIETKTKKVRKWGC